MFNREFYFSSIEGCVSSFNFKYELVSENMKKSPIQSIYLELSGRDYIEVALYITHAENTNGSVLKEQLKKNFSIIRYNNYQEMIYVKSKDGRIKNCQPIIDFLHEHGAIDKETYDTLISDINFPITNDKVKEMLISTAKESITEAKKKAFEWNNYKCTDSIWDLAEFLKNTGEHQEAMELYQNIPVEHYRYKAAQLAMKDIILWMLQAHQNQELRLTPQEVRQYKEDLLRLSINGGDVQYATQLFFELSGMPMRADYPTIKPDEETLIMLSREMLKLNQRIIALEREVKNKSTSAFKLFDQKTDGNTIATIPTQNPSSEETKITSGKLVLTL